jgi:hypothetical protein
MKKGIDNGMQHWKLKTLAIQRHYIWRNKWNSSKPSSCVVNGKRLSLHIIKLIRPKCGPLQWKSTSCLNLVILAYAMNQSWVQWLLSNVLTTSTTLIMKLFVKMVQALNGTETLDQFDFEFLCFQKIFNKTLWKSKTISLLFLSFLFGPSSEHVCHNARSLIQIITRCV